MRHGPRRGKDMRSLRSYASVLAVSAVAVLLGASCASSNKPVDAGDEPKGDQAVGSAASEFPTFSCAGFWTGVWCGGNYGFPGSPYALYYCSNGTAQLVQVCPGYCHAGTIGVEDHC